MIARLLPFEEFLEQLLPRGAVGIAAPVRDAAGAVIAVLYISSPSMRMRPPRPRNLLPQVMDAAVKLSQALGGASKPSQTGLVREDATPAGWPLNGGMLTSSRPHTIFR